MLDIAIIILYLSLSLVIGVLYKNRQESFRGFARLLDPSYQGSKILIISNIFAAAIGGGTIFGLSEKIFYTNLGYCYALLLAIPIDLIIANLIVPKIALHQGAETVGDIMNKAYGNVGRQLSFISTIFVGLGLVAAQINVCGRIFEFIAGIEFLWGVLISYCIMIIYSTVGGFRSVLFTNLLQFFVMIVAVPVVSFFALSQMGLDNFIAQAPYQKISPFTNHEVIATTIGIFLSFLAMKMHPSFIQRVLINKDPKFTISAIYVKSAMLFIFTIFIGLNGILSYMLFGDAPSYLALHFMIDQTVPSGFQGLVIAGLLSAVMSTASAELNITAISFTKDFLGANFNISQQSKLLLIARITNIIAGGGTLILALSFSSVVDLVIFSSGLWGPLTLVPLVFYLFGYTIAVRHMLVCSIIGGLSFITWDYFLTFSQGGAFLNGTFIGTAVTMVLFLGFISGKKESN